MKDKVFGDLMRVEGGGWMLGADPAEYFSERTGVDPSHPDFKSKMMDVDLDDLMRSFAGQAALDDMSAMIGGVGGKKSKKSSNNGAPAKSHAPLDLRSADPIFAHATVIITDKSGKGPTAAQREAYRRMTTDAAAVAKSITDEVFVAIHELVTRRPELRDGLKPPKTAAALRKKLQVSDVRFETKEKDGVAYATATVRDYTDEPDSSVEVTLLGDRVAKLGELREAKRGSQTLDHPALGALAFDGEYGWWEGKVALPFFDDFHGTGAAPKKKAQSKKSQPVQVSIIDEKGKGLSAAQQKAARQLAAKQEQIGRAVAAAIFKDYQQQYAESAEEWAGDKRLPKLDSVDGVKRVVELTGVTIHREEKDGAAYVGLSFNCTWDEEHGCGVLTRDGRVVAVGAQDTAFTEGHGKYEEKQQKGKWS